MLKRIMPLGLIVLLIFSLCACSSDKQQDTDESNYEGEIDIVSTEYYDDDYGYQGGFSEDESGDENFLSKCTYFCTEYFVEDYNGGLFEVSKNDSLLHGVYDHTGKEILPVKYDEIEFFYMPKAKKVFIKARYEDKQFLFDVNGKQLQDITDKEVSFAESTNGTEVYICLGKDNTTEIYDDSFTNIIATVPLKYVIPIVPDNHYLGLNDDSESAWLNLYVCDKSSGKLTQHSSKIVMNVVQYHTITANAENYAQTIDMRDDIKSDFRAGSTIVVAHDNVRNNYFNDYYLIGINGNLYDDLSYEKYLDSEFSYLRGEVYAKDYISDKVKLYETNSTWKYEWADTNEPIFDERYYEKLDIGDDYIFFLTNEDNQVCVVDYSGNKIIDYSDGFTYNNDSEKLEYFESDISIPYVDSCGFAIQMGNGIYFYKF